MSRITTYYAGFTQDRRLTKRGENGGLVITVRKDAKLHLSNGTLKGGWGGAPNSSTTSTSLPYPK